MMFTSGYGDRVVVYVTVAQPLPVGDSLVVTLGNTKYTMASVTATLYRVQFDAPSTTNTKQSFTFGVEYKQGGRVAYALDPAGGFIVRRSTFPIGDVVLQPSL